MPACLRLQHFVISFFFVALMLIAIAGISALYGGKLFVYFVQLPFSYLFTF